MDLRNDLGLSHSRLDHALVFWRCRDKRRAVVTGDYSISSDYLARLRSRRHVSDPVSTPVNVRALDESGSVLTVERGEHCIGMMRPLLLGDEACFADLEIPFLIAYELEDGCLPPRLPILATSRDDAAAFVRRAKLACELDTKRWRKYECERVRGILGGLLFDLDKRRPLNTFKTELERELYFETHRRKRRAQRPAA